MNTTNQAIICPSEENSADKDRRDLSQSAFSKEARLIAAVLTGVAGMSVSAVAQNPSNSASLGVSIFDSNIGITPGSIFDDNYDFAKDFAQFGQGDHFTGDLNLPPNEKWFEPTTPLEYPSISSPNFSDLSNRNRVQLRFFEMETADWHNRIEVQTSVKEAGMRLQPLGSCPGKIRRDYYSVRVNKLPDWFNPEEFIQKLAADPNGAIKGQGFNFDARFERQSDSPKAKIGDRFEIKTPWIPFLGRPRVPIVIVDIQPDRFTIEALGDNRDERTREDHPVAGRRMWGFERISAGEYDFYTQGIGQLCDVPWYPGFLLRFGQNQTWIDQMNGFRDQLQPWAEIDKDQMRFNKW